MSERAKDKVLALLTGGTPGQPLTAAELAFYCQVRAQLRARARDAVSEELADQSLLADQTAALTDPDGARALLAEWTRS